MFNHQQRGRISPLQIIDGHQHRLARGQLLHQVTNRLEQPEPQPGKLRIRRLPSTPSSLTSSAETAARCGSAEGPVSPKASMSGPLDEFVTTVAQFEQENHLRGLQLIFDVFDPDGDGTISAQEYRGLATIFNIDPTQADEIFLRLDLSGDGSISREEFTQLWIDFWYSEDKNAAGNWMFGPY